MGHEGHDHGHEHEHHEHGHEHEHEHEHHHHDLLFLDAPSGLAGDMIIAALVDMGTPRDVVMNAIHALNMGGFHVHFGHKTRSGIVASTFDVHVDGEQPERTFKEIRSIIEKSALTDAIKHRALHTFEHLARSESKVHKMKLDDVHFHEVGAVDAIVDIVGAAALLDHLGVEIIVSPLPMGRGFVKARHGTLPLPAPATVECLAGFETYDAGIQFELVTPTGAAIVAANAVRSERWPRMKPQHVGWGSGKADLADRPNLLRAILGEKVRDAHHESHVVLECNLDDATGEILGYAIETLVKEGALDAWATPITMKKGRPAVVLSAIVARDRADHTAEVMLRETTSLGVRRYPVDRLERPRRTLEVETPFGKIPVKIAEGPYGPAQIKPEYEACAEAARAHKVPVREVIRAALVGASRR